MVGENNKCLLCGSNKLITLNRYAKDGLVECVDCHFVFSKWIPSIEELISHYGTYSRKDDISPITILRYKELIAGFEKYRINNNWLDVGCGNGHLLKTAKDSGWNVYGTEFTENALKICESKGINMHLGKLNPDNYNQAFDIITSIEVIEHINDFHEELEKFKKLLRKGGFLYITTPNFNSISRFMLKELWSIIEYPEHLCYFNPSTLDRVLKEHGFKKLWLTTSGISISRLQHAFGKIEAQTAKSTEEKFRKKTEENQLFAFFKKSANTILNITGTGDALKALYYKK